MYVCIYTYILKKKRPGENKYVLVDIENGILSKQYLSSWPSQILTMFQALFNTPTF